MAIGLEGGVLTGAGILIVISVWLDFMTTAMTASSTGIFSRSFSYGLHQLFNWGSKVFHSQKWRVAAGPCITLALIFLWFGLSWLGWSLIYLASEGSVVSSSDHLPAQMFEIVYFVGFTLTTLGTGDFVPNGTLWELMSVVTAFNGLVLVTLSITYAIPVIQATAEKRALSNQFAVWGNNAKLVLQHIESDRSYTSLPGYLKTVSTEILLVAQNHLAYPILHYFHSPTEKASFALQVSVLDEVLRNLPDEAFEKQAELYVLVPNCTKAISEFLTTLSSVHIKAANNEPPALRCASANIAYRLVEQHSTISVTERRKLLKALVEENGWSWQKVVGCQKPVATAT